jgi:hypothetical protein
MQLGSSEVSLHPAMSAARPIRSCRVLQLTPSGCTVQSGNFNCRRLTIGCEIADEVAHASTDAIVELGQMVVTHF